MGLLNEGVLVQEFLDGIEYVVDSVSRDGVHKTTAVWEYDKRSINGANFVYFGMRIMDASEPVAKVLIDYSNSVLDALEIVSMIAEPVPCFMSDIMVHARPHR